jgi:hypothetical protein
METGIIKSDIRHTMRSMKKAMQGNVIRALVELITNAEDSYIRLDSEGNKGQEQIIEILYEKEGYDCQFAVRDQAEGMSLDDIKRGFTHYGAATSGLKKGIKVRGYFGQGAKDALASMAKGRICTIKDAVFVECRILVKNNEPTYEIDDPITVTDKIRKEHGIVENGTVAYFLARYKHVTIPQFDTVQEELANNYLLRKIMMNQSRKIYVVEVNSDRKRRLRYRLPEGKLLVRDSFRIEFGKYGYFPVDLELFRAENCELEQAGDGRTGGLLIVDEEDVVLGISLFKYNNEPLAARFCGELRINNFRKLLENEEPVLSDDRDGLEHRHPFCQKLIKKTEEYLTEKVKEESVRKQKEEQSKILGEEKKRYQKAFSILNQIAEEEAKEITNLGSDIDDDINAPTDGICFYPTVANITVGKRYNFELRIDPSAIKKESDIKIDCNSSKIKIHPTSVRLIDHEKREKIVRKYISVEGREANIEGIVLATVGKRSCSAKVNVVPEQEMLLTEGMVFDPENITIRPNQPRKASLYVYVKMIEHGSVIKLSSDNDSIQFTPNEIVVNENDAKRGMAKYDIELWGEQEGQSAMVSAEYETYMAILGVHIKSKKDQQDKDNKGMFSEPDFDFDPDPIQRSSYSQTTGKIIIYVNFPTVKMYLGDSRQFAKTLTAQVLVADLVAERCFHEIAKKKAEASGALAPEAIPDRIRSYQFALSKKYGKKVHELLVDQEQLRKSQSQFKLQEKKAAVAAI